MQADIDIPPHLKIYSTADVAQILRLSVYRVRQLIRLGRLKAYCHLSKCNTKRIFVTESDLKDFLYGDYLEAYWRGNRRPQARQDERQKRLVSGEEYGETEQASNTGKQGDTHCTPLFSGDL